jgi:hypothetical protein
VWAAVMTVGNITPADDLSPISAALIAYDRVIAHKMGMGFENERHYGRCGPEHCQPTRGS